MHAVQRTRMIIVILLNTLVYTASGGWVQTNGPCGGSFEAIAIDDSVLYTSVFERGIFKSADKGRSWSAVNSGLVKRDVYSIASVGSELFAGTELNGLYYCSGNNGAWSPFESKSGNTYNRILNMIVRGGEIWAATDDGLVLLHKKNGEWIDSLMHPMTWSQTFAVTDSFIFVTASELMERSSDHGSTWVACTTGLPQSSISSLIMLDNSTGFAGTADGVYVTGNSGDSWSLIGGAMDADNNYGIRGFAARNDTILFSTTDRIWLSIDRGVTWENFNPEFTFYYPGKIGLIGNSVFLATSKGIFTSSFSDRKWIDISTGVVSGSVATMLNVEGTIFAGCDANRKLYRSEDKGMNWVVSDSGFSDESTVHAVTYFNSVLFAGCDKQRLMQSADFGRTWQVYDFKIGVATSFIQVNGNLTAGHELVGIHTLASGETRFQEANSGLEQEIPECGCSSPYPTPLSFAALDSIVFAGLENHGIFASVNNGPWHGVNSGLADTIVPALFTTNGIVLAGTRDRGIFRSTDRGASWTGCETDLSGKPVLSFANNGTTVFAGTAEGVFYSIDSGVTWSKGETAFNEEVRSLLADGEYLLAGTSTGGVWRRPIDEFTSGVREHQRVSNEINTFFTLQRRGSTVVCRFKLAHSEWVTMKLYNPEGKMVALLKSSQVPAGEHSFAADLHMYKSGYYIIRFEGGAVRRSTPFIISQHP